MVIEVFDLEENFRLQWWSPTLTNCFFTPFTTSATRKLISKTSKTLGLLNNNRSLMFDPGYITDGEDSLTPWSTIVFQPQVGLAFIYLLITVVVVQFILMSSILMSSPMQLHSYGPFVQELQDKAIASQSVVLCCIFGLILNWIIADWFSYTTTKDHHLLQCFQPHVHMHLRIREPELSKVARHSSETCWRNFLQISYLNVCSPLAGRRPLEIFPS